MTYAGMLISGVGWRTEHFCERGIGESVGKAEGGSRGTGAGGIVRWQSLIEAGPSPAREPADGQERLRMFRESGGELDG